jgi:hypothetical protein
MSSYNPPFPSPAMPQYTGQCLHIGSVLDGCFVPAVPLYYINIYSIVRVIIVLEY